MKTVKKTISVLAVLAFVLAGVPARSVSATPGENTIVSVDSSGAQGNNGSYDASISADGRFVAFISDASNLVEEDNNGLSDVFVHDRQTGTTTRVSVDSSGNEVNGASSEVTISATGRYVTFKSFANNLVAVDTNGYLDVFVHDRQTATTELVSVASDETQGNGDSFAHSVSADGRYVAFDSAATNLMASDTNGENDAFVRDRQTGTTICVSVDSSGTLGSDWSSNPFISANGTFVTFESSSTNLAAGDTTHDFDVFVHNLDTGETTLVSVDSSGIKGNGNSFNSSISSDGHYVAFRSYATNLVGGDNNGYEDAFVHDRITGTTTRVSIASDGTQGNADAGVPWISDDGRTVAFASSATNLVDGDTNGASDIFVHDRQTGITKRITVSLSGTQGNGESHNASMSADGRYVAFQSSATNLTTSDTNGGTRDIFVHDNSVTQSLTLRSTSAYDGWILESSEASNTGGTLDRTGTTFNLGDEAGDKQYRAILSFTTSGVPDNAIITKVTLKIKRQAQVGTNPFTILGGLKAAIRKPYFGTSAGLLTNDFNATAGKSLAGTFGMSPVSNWYSAVIGSAAYPYLNKTGTTQFRLYFTKDDNDDMGPDYMKFFSGDYGIVSARPTLIIEYYLP